MSGSVNKVILIGNVGKDPEIRSAANGKQIASFSVATSETWRDKTSGERRERTEWNRVVIFSGGLVRIVEQYVKKGSKLYIEGQLQTRKWQDQSGNDRYATEVVLNGFDAKLLMLSGKENSGGRSDKDARTPSAGDGGSVRTGSDLDDEIPFAPEFR